MKKKEVLTIIIALSLFCGGAILLSSKPLVFRKLQDRYLYGKRGHYLSCEELPAVAKIDKTVLENKETVNQIVIQVAQRHRHDEIKPYWDFEKRMVTDSKERGYITFLWGHQGIKDYFVLNCSDPNKGDIFFIYNSEKDLKIIEKIIGDDFFGIPYRGANM